jgi:hypothetical protein
MLTFSYPNNPDNGYVCSCADRSKSMGCNESDRAYCHRCNFSFVLTSMEQLEAVLQKHLREEHGLKVLYRIDNETGKTTEIPQ